ncbi:CBS domain-containing protein [Nakamurella panacisegetis]|uniref:CBS domain-containing protein n=1 Tax=Nakamurella panacisegetis TaxID=1090615 RepID=A0A1H0SU48_9ACTN|nr:CBS domain-containing protein [Nakamurella panacisegetis]SDP45204.1 CBS domain-containing protein [Nakamurella panacisegetis]
MNSSPQAHRLAPPALVGLTSRPPPTAGHLMNCEFVAVEAESTLEQAAGLLAGSGLPALPVRGPDNRLLGTVTVTGVLAAVAAGTDRSAPVGAVMDRHPAAVAHYAPVESILGEMDDAGLWVLPVVDGSGRLVGLVSLSNLDGAISRALLAHTWARFAEFHRE